MVQELIKTYLHRSYDGETGQFYTSANILTAVGLMKHHNYFLYTHSLYENMWQLWHCGRGLYTNNGSCGSHCSVFVFVFVFVSFTLNTKP